jgi:hypothetical protein
VSCSCDAVGLLVGAGALVGSAAGIADLTATILGLLPPVVARSRTVALTVAATSVQIAIAEVAATSATRVATTTSTTPAVEFAAIVALTLARELTVGIITDVEEAA